MKRLLVFITLILVVVLVRLQIPVSDEPLADGMSLQDVKTIFPFAAEIVPTEEGAVSVLDSSGEKIGYVLTTKGYSDHIKGWGGPTPVLIGVDAAGIVVDVHLLDNEDSAYINERIKNSDFLDSWNGISIDKVNSINVDAVTSATMTSTSIIRSIANRASIWVRAESERVYLPLRSAIVEIVIMVLALILCFSKFKRKNIARILLLVVSVIYLGFLKKFMLSINLIDVYLHATAINLFITPLAGLLIISLIVPIVTGKSFYCRYLCPFGALQELMGKVPIPPIKMSKRISEGLRFIKAILLIGALVVVVFRLPFDLANVEPFSAFFMKAAGMVPLIIAIVFVVLSLSISRPWCRYFCPTGALLEIVRKKGSDENKTS